MSESDASQPGTAADAALGPAEYARLCVEAYAAGDQPPRPPDHPLYGRVAACFCSIKKRGGLRGCIGTLEPAEPTLADEIARNAWSAAFRDPRFPPVQADELDALTYSVDVLSPCEPCRLTDLDPAVYGVIVSLGWRRGVLLPALEGVDTVERQLSIALQKAGIGPDEPYVLQRFTVARYGQAAGCDTACG